MKCKEKVEDMSLEGKVAAYMVVEKEIWHKKEISKLQENI